MSPSSKPDRPFTGAVWWFGASVFASALLLFLVQPIISKSILPWFGGSPGVWTVCLLFFQGLLLLGYCYAHFLIQHASPGWQVAIHGALLALAAAQLPIIPNAAWQPTDAARPTTQILLLLAATIGLPLFALSATAPLLQSWFAGVLPGRSPYRLYALSNAGSLLALLSYPFLVEPALDVRWQAYVWSAGYVVFALLCLRCALAARRASPVVTEKRTEKRGAPAAALSWSTVALWFSLAMVPSVMLLAVTDLLCTDIAVVPFLWVLPLALYLASFIVCFEHERWYRRGPWLVAWGVLLAIFATRTIFVQEWRSWPVVATGGSILLLFFATCMLCHGELYRLRPEVRRLTQFYLTLAAGGAAGSIAVALVAPLLFPLPVELPLAVVAAGFLVAAVVYRDPASVLYRGARLAAWAGLLLALVAVVGLFVRDFMGQMNVARLVRRNFYGVLRVEFLMTPAQESYARLLHGSTNHGMEFITPLEKQRTPTAYYTRQSAIGILLAQDEQRPRRVGVVGLGAGTLASYGRAGDVFRFYEINPAVIDVAENLFEFLKLSQATIEPIAAQDARLALAHESPQGFDVLVLDAFSSDAIPVHLLTEEAVALYLSHLRPGGVLAIHTSNLHLDLAPTVAALADRFGLTAVYTFHDPSADEQMQFLARPAAWVLLAKSAERLPLAALRTIEAEPPVARVLWTDKYSSVLPLFHF